MHNNETLSRRELIARGSALGLPIALAGTGVMSMVKQTIAAGGESGAGDKASWPIACRDAHLKETGAADSWAALKAIGADGAEVMVNQDLECAYLYAPGEKFDIKSPDAARSVGKRFAEAGLKITAFCLATKYDRDMDREIDFTLKVAAAAKQLGVPAVRIDVVPHEVKKDAEFLKLAIEVGRRLIRGTAGEKVRFGVENHGRMTNKVEFLRKLLVEVEDPRFGVTLDTANFYWFGYPLSRLYEFYFEFARLACHTHAKSIGYPKAEREKQRPMGWEYAKYCCPVYEGDIDFMRVAKIFRERGFTGNLCIENESLERFPAKDRGEILRKEIEYLRKAARMA